MPTITEMGCGYGRTYHAACDCREAEWEAVGRENRELRERLAAAEARLPEGMKHCTILSRECEKGHGWLTATNWAEFPCPICALNAERGAHAETRRESANRYALWRETAASLAAAEECLREIREWAAGLGWLGSPQDERVEAEVLAIIARAFLAGGKP